jgi:hypothetical protein
MLIMPPVGVFQVIASDLYEGYCFFSKKIGIFSKPLAMGI